MTFYRWQITDIDLNEPAMLFRTRYEARAMAKEIGFCCRIVRLPFLYCKGEQHGNG